jgi:glycosyltransferase involved in cell wall biosynthesis
MTRHLNVLIVIKEEFHNAPRPQRFFSFCSKQGYNIEIACSSSSIKDLSSIPLAIEISNPKIGKYERMLLKIFRVVIPFSFIKNKINEHLYGFKALGQLLKKKQYDLIYVADLHMIPLIVKYKKAAKIIFDAREYYPLQYEDNMNFRFFEKGECIRILNETLNKCDQVLTVSQGLADAYQNNFGIKPEIVLSLPNYQKELITNVSKETIKILYHGMANRNRKIENFIKILDHLTINAELHLYLVGDKTYIKELEDIGNYNSKIFFHDPVPFQDIIHTLNQYDVGICYYEPISFNIRHCLPNKFFEYLQARLVVAIGPSPDMAEILTKFKCGIISQDFNFESMVKELNLLTRNQINKLKQKSDEAARHLCFENEEIKFSKIISALY